MTLVVKSMEVFMFHVVLIEPEIPWNTGNIGRTCLGAGAELHLVGRLGFHLDDKQVERAGLDYWEKVKLHRHESWEDFLKSLVHNICFIPVSYPIL